MPSYVLVLVILLSNFDYIVGVRQLSLHNTIRFRLCNLIVINDSLPTDNNLRTELTKHRTSSDNTDSTAFIGVRNELTVNHIPLLIFINDNLVEPFVLSEE